MSMSVCLSARITRKPHGLTSPFCACACCLAYDHSSILLWRRQDTGALTEGYPVDLPRSLASENLRRWAISCGVVAWS